MKTDRELLELAAKAAGIGPVIGFAAESCGLMIGPRAYVRYWRPLTDDGDALRLAVKLKLDINFLEGYQEVIVQAYDFWAEATVAYTDDRGQDVRRAIVREAAAIGECME